MRFEKIKGLIAATYTPMRSDGAINPNVIPAYAEKLKSEGVRGVFICGTTGEGMLLSSEERKTIANYWIKEQSEDFRVIVHVGTTSVIQSKELAIHAQQAGAFGVGCMGPIFLKPTHLEELIAYCADVSSGCSNLPFYYYHIPSVSAIHFPMVDFLQCGQKRISNLAGIKFTDNNFMDMQQCLNMDDGNWDILHGLDEVLLTGLVFGAEGAVGSTYNFLAPMYYDIMNDFKNGRLDSARRNQMSSIKFIEILKNNGGVIPAGKALMKMAGLDCGPCRLSLKNLNEIEFYHLKREIEISDYFVIYTN